MVLTDVDERHATHTICVCGVGFEERLSAELLCVPTTTAKFLKSCETWVQCVPNYLLYMCVCVSDSAVSTPPDRNRFRLTGSTWTNQITWDGVGVFQSARSDWTWGPLEYKQHNKPTMSVSSQSSDVIKSYIKNNSDYIQTLLLFVLKVVYQVECF